MNFIKLKLFVWKHPGSLSIVFLIPAFIIPLIVIPYFFIALLYLLFFENSGMIGKSIMSAISPKPKSKKK